jgi:hypothetical protein
LLKKVKGGVERKKMVIGSNIKIKLEKKGRDMKRSKALVFTRKTKSPFSGGQFEAPSPSP